MKRRYEMKQIGYESARGSRFSHLGTALRALESYVPRNEWFVYDRETKQRATY